jgi:arylsulfatase A-like enzyme
VEIPAYLPDLPIVREDLAEMEASIASMDHAVGEILAEFEKRGLSENTLFVLTADHGIPFPRSKMSLYDPGLEVPLIFAGPRVPRGESREQLTSHIDVLPTLLDYLGLPAAAGLHGRSIVAAIEDAAVPGDEHIFGEKTYHTYYDPMRCVRTDRWKLIANFEFAPQQETSPDFWNNSRGYPEVALATKSVQQPYHPPFELYDLEADPLEKHNLADSAEHAVTLSALCRVLYQTLAETNDPLLEGPIPQAAYLQRMSEFRRRSQA